MRCVAYYGGPGLGGKNYAGKQDEVDYASVGQRPPGSSFKPYVLAAALSQTLAGKKVGNQELTVSSTVSGASPMLIGGTSIRNDPGDGSVPSTSVANAMKLSLNTTFDQMAYDVGPSMVAKTAYAMGIPSDLLKEADGTTNFGIGIGDYPISPLDQAVGYATLASGGIHHAAYFVQKVTTADRIDGVPAQEHRLAGAGPAGGQRRHPHHAAGRVLVQRPAGRRAHQRGQDRHGRDPEQHRPAPTATPGWPASPRRSRPRCGSAAVTPRRRW